MTVKKTPNTTDITLEPPIRALNYAVGIGETEEREWSEDRALLLEKYEQLKTEIEAGNPDRGNIVSLQYGYSAGRGRLVVRYERSDPNNNPALDGSRLVEELYAVDVLRDVRAAPYWATGGDGAITDDNIAVVTAAVEKSYTESEIDANLDVAWASWTDAMKDLRWHMMRGQDSYFETAFILRRSAYGVYTNSIKAIFTNINRVVDAPTFQSKMDELIDELPPGEWLYKPPQAQQLGNGVWRVSNEWHWAKQWSVVYGGTLKRPTP